MELKFEQRLKKSELELEILFNLKYNNWDRTLQFIR